VCALLLVVCSDSKQLQCRAVDMACKIDSMPRVCKPRSSCGQTIISVMPCS
jgi:hypothetical protein